MNTTIYFGQINYVYDEYGNATINHEVGGLWFWQVFDDVHELNKLVIEWHVGDGIYTQITEFI